MAGLGLVALVAFVIAIAGVDLSPLTGEVCPLFGRRWAGLADLIPSHGHWGMAVAVGLVGMYFVWTRFGRASKKGELPNG